MKIIKPFQRTAFFSFTDTQMTNTSRFYHEVKNNPRKRTFKIYSSRWRCWHLSIPNAEYPKLAVIGSTAPTTHGAPIAATTTRTTPTSTLGFGV
jgi:hypothetical protein